MILKLEDFENGKLNKKGFKLRSVPVFGFVSLAVLVLAYILGFIGNSPDLAIINEEL